MRSRHTYMHGHHMHMQAALKEIDAGRKWPTVRDTVRKTASVRGRNSLVPYTPHMHMAYVAQINQAALLWPNNQEAMPMESKRSGWMIWTQATEKAHKVKATQAAAS